MMKFMALSFAIFLLTSVASAAPGDMDVSSRWRLSQMFSGSQTYESLQPFVDCYNQNHVGANPPSGTFVAEVTLDGFRFKCLGTQTALITWPIAHANSYHMVPIVKGIDQSGKVNIVGHSLTDEAALEMEEAFGRHGYSPLVSPSDSRIAESAGNAFKSMKAAHDAKEAAANLSH